jgi:hypothetical protein
MNTNKKSLIAIVTVMMISFLSACTVVVHDGHRHHHPHPPVVHEDVIVR